MGRFCREGGEPGMLDLWEWEWQGMGWVGEGTIVVDKWSGCERQAGKLMVKTEEVVDFGG